MTRPPPPPYRPPGTRGVGLRDRPTVSVVVSSQGPPAALAACLASLADQARRHEAEIIVARADPDAKRLQAAHPTARFVAAEAGADRPALRELGLTAASGDIVALIDDDCIAAAGWLDRLVMAGAADDASSGPIPPRGGNGSTDWVTYLATHRASDPAPEVAIPPARLFEGSLLDDIVALAAPGTWEPLVHPERGPGPSAPPPVGRPEHYQPTSVRRFCRDRFAQGRACALRRLRDTGGERRYTGLAGACLLPFRTAWPLTKAVRQRGRHPLLFTLPLAIIILAAWGLGEASGYVQGAEAAPPR